MGAGREGADLTYVKLGTGVGAGHHRPPAQHGGTAGEIGHVFISSDGTDCSFGNRSLTTRVGTPALLARAKESGVRVAGEELSVLSFIAAARAGEANAVRLIETVAGELAIAVANLLNLLNPSIVVIGGDLAQAGDLLIDPLRTAVKGRALFTSIANTRIVGTTLSFRATAVGAATMVLEAALKDRTLFANGVGTAAWSTLFPPHPGFARTSSSRCSLVSCGVSASRASRARLVGDDVDHDLDLDGWRLVWNGEFDGPGTGMDTTSGSLTSASGRTATAGAATA